MARIIGGYRGGESDLVRRPPTALAAQERSALVGVVYLDDTGRGWVSSRSFMTSISLFFRRQAPLYDMPSWRLIASVASPFLLWVRRYMARNKVVRKRIPSYNTKYQVAIIVMEVWRIRLVLYPETAGNDGSTGSYLLDRNYGGFNDGNKQSFVSYTHPCSYHDVHFASGI